MPSQSKWSESIWGSGSHSCECQEQRHHPRLIVLTGGPSAGKTAVLEMILKTFCSHVTIIPEAASIIFGGGFFRRDSLPARKGAQRAIFKVQRELEQIVLEEKKAAVAICDRGTVDGLAYWPESEETYWAENGTTGEKELSRYEAVIHLRTPDLARGYNHDNPVRIESANEAMAIDQKLLSAWVSHPHRHLIESQDDFFTKARLAMEAVRTYLPTCCQNAKLNAKSGGKS
ncbi:MAG: hypothetical protein CL678_06730 [Bdellovibrionaceae bacterium]|nr:hypothetical protein [Pseudobdellovibrionaceae bacterium]